MTETKWSFEERKSDRRKEGDIPTRHALEKKVETFVREVLQNASDAGLENDDPVEVYFRIRRLEGEDEIRQFLNALNWDELKLHINGARGGDHSLRLQEFLNEVEEEEKLLLLTVEDRNTKGLIGREDAQEDTNYTALVRDMNVSHKEGTSGGSHGVGKTVLWAFSGMATVLFTSDLSEEDAGQESPRFIGRTILPDHRVEPEDQDYKGLGWFGVEREGSTRPVSLWGDEAEKVASELGVSRSHTNEPGTSATVIGFNEPTGNFVPDVDELIDEFRKSTVKYFWPLMYHQELEVYIQSPGESPEKVEIDSLPEIKPFVRCFAGRHNPDDEFGTPGSQLTGSIDFIPQDIKDSFQGDLEINGENVRGIDDGEVSLSVRKIAPGDDDTLAGHVAMFRGAGIVVGYKDMGGAVSEGGFHGVLACGEARAWGDGEPTVSDKYIDDFLEAAEPAEHRNWTSTDDLKKKYKRGCVSTVKSLRGSKLREKLEELLSDDIDLDGILVDSISRNFKIGGSAPGSSGSSSTTTNNDSLGWKKESLYYDGDKWVFAGYIEPEEDVEKWFVNISMSRRGDNDKKVDDLEIADVDTEADYHMDSDGSVSLEYSGDKDKIQIRGGSETIGTTDPLSGKIGRVKLGVNGEVKRRSKKEEGDEE